LKRKPKYLTAIVILLTFILFSLIRLEYPLQVSTETSILHMIPIHFWILIIIIPVFISITFILTESKSICVMLGVIYFFVLFSYYLFFEIPPAGTDMSERGNIFFILKESTTLSVDKIGYFQWPIHFSFYMILKKLLGAGLAMLTIGLFSFILIIPIAYSLFPSKSSINKVYFLLPVGYILLSFYFINLQWVPQFTGLIFLIFTIGCYLKYRENNSREFYWLTILFYTICVFSHPFIFVFFPAAIFLDRYIIPKKIFHRTYQNAKKMSLSLLVAIYSIGFLFRFVRMEDITRRLVFAEGEGRSWDVIYRLLGSAPETTAEYETSILYRFVSENTHLFFRYSTMAILILIVFILGYILLKNLMKIDSFDISLGVGGAGFFLFGFIDPTVIGSRAFQVIFLGVPRYFKDVHRGKSKLLVFLLVLCITISPFLFTMNSAINQSLSGGRYVQDDATIRSGEFIIDNVESRYNVSVAELSFYPGRNIDEYNFTVYNTRDMADGTIEIGEIDMIVISAKHSNRMEYFGVEYDENGTSQIYDMGDGKVLISK